MSTAITVKRGATLLLQGACTQDDGTPIDLTSVQMTSSLRDPSGNLVFSMAVTMTMPVSGQFTLTAPSNATSLWPVGQLAGDICYVQGGVVIYSETFAVAVHGSITPTPVVLHS